ncbi:MAG TPA: HEPN domain-containing protein [Thermomicrobiales bacterium]|nr:HEPN domain-containing protein [Thermomicrobiales bacterium]
MTPFDWREFLAFAEEIVAGGSATEASHRSAVSRAYYAVFNLARAHLVAEHRIDPTRHEAHDQVWVAFEAGSRAERRIGQGGRRLRYWRNWADYEDTYPHVAWDAASLVALARRLTAELDALRAAPER